MLSIHTDRYLILIGESLLQTVSPQTRLLSLVPSLHSVAVGHFLKHVGKSHCECSDHTAGLAPWQVRRCQAAGPSWEQGGDGGASEVWAHGWAPSCASGGEALWSEDLLARDLRNKGRARNVSCGVGTVQEVFTRTKLFHLLLFLCLSHQVPG